MFILKILGKGFGFEKLFVIMMSAIAGVSVGFCIHIINKTVEHFFHGKTSLYHAAFFALLVAAFTISKRIALIKGRALVEKNMAEIRISILAQIRLCSLIRIENTSQADIIVRLTAAVQQISNSVDKAVNASSAVITLLFCGIYIALLSRRAFFMVILFSAIAVLRTNYSKKLIGHDIQRLSDNKAGLFDSFRHAFSGFKELKINRKKEDDFFENNLHSIRREVKKQEDHVNYKFVDIRLFNVLLFYIALPCLAISSLSMERVVLYQVVTTVFFAWPFITAIIEAMGPVGKANIAADRLYELEKKFAGHVKTSDSAYPGEVDHEKDFRKIVFENISFNYTDKEGEPSFAMGPVDLSVNAGEIVFVTGGNGSGKSTLLKVLTGLYPPLAGSVEINGQPVAMGGHRHLFSAVFADFHLFDRLYGLENVDEEKVDALLKLFRLAHKTELSKDGFTNLDLSTGEKKRLALIIAILEDRPIYIFDEWAAEQDPDFRKYFYKHLLGEFKSDGKTVIAATHDERYFHAADRIVRMEYGRILRNMED